MPSSDPYETPEYAGTPAPKSDEGSTADDNQVVKPFDTPAQPDPVVDFTADENESAAEALVASANRPGPNVLPEAEDVQAAEPPPATRSVRVRADYGVDEVAFSLPLASLADDVDTDEHGRVVLTTSEVELPAELADLLATSVAVEYTDEDEGANE